MSPSTCAGPSVYQSTPRVAGSGVAADVSLKGPPWTHEPIQPEHTTPQSSHYVRLGDYTVACSENKHAVEDFQAAYSRTLGLVKFGGSASASEMHVPVHVEV